MLARWVVRVVFRHSARAGTTTGRLQMGSGGPTFSFGSSLDDQRLRELKKQGVKAIVSLQDPSVLVELQGINEERNGALGDRPTTVTSIANVDAFLWIKAPRESDGASNGVPAAGAWMPDYALGLAQRASY